ncbi:MAG: hypothetical protein ACFFCQ_12365 [Promethearchaeota archaeon]
MTLFPTILFEILVYILFIITSYVAKSRHGKNVFILFTIIIGIAFYIEIAAISRQGYDYLDFMIVFENYPFALPFGWVVFFYWAHTMAEGLITWKDDSWLRVILLAITTGVITGSMSLFLETGGQALGWWIYHTNGIWGVTLLDLPLEIFLTYLAWGAADGLIFRTAMWFGFIKRNKFKPSIIIFVPSLCCLGFFIIMAIATYFEDPELVLLWLFNVNLYPIVSIIRFYEDEFKEKVKLLT